MEGVQYRGGTPSVWTSVCIMDQSHRQYVGGTSSVRTPVCSTEEGVCNEDHSHLQYSGGTASGWMRVCNTDQSYHLGDLREKFSRERSGQGISLLNHLKQGLLPWNS